MSEYKGITKFQLVQMFGELDFIFEICQEDIDEGIQCSGYYSQEFTWNDIACSNILFEEEEYPELTVHIVKEVCADFILSKIGKAIEVQL